MEQDLTPVSNPFQYVVSCTAPDGTCAGVLICPIVQTLLCSFELFMHIWVSWDIVCTLHWLEVANISVMVLHVVVNQGD